MVDGIRDVGLHFVYANEQETVRAGSGKVNCYKVNYVFTELTIHWTWDDNLEAYVTLSFDKKFVLIASRYQLYYFVIR